SRNGAVASRAGNRGRQFARRLKILERHGIVLPQRDSRALSGTIFEGRCAEGRCRASERLRDWRKQVAAFACLARGLLERLCDSLDAALFIRGIETQPCSVESQRRSLR